MSVELKGDERHCAIVLGRFVDGDLEIRCRDEVLAFNRQQEEELLGWLLRWAKSDQRPRPLRTVDEYNVKARAEREEWVRRKWWTGVACPKCGKELIWSGDDWWTNNPNQTTRGSRCLGCQLVIDLEST